MRTTVNLFAGFLLYVSACVLSPQVKWRERSSFSSVTGQTPGGNRAPRCILYVPAVQILNVQNQTTYGQSVGMTAVKTFGKSSPVRYDKVIGARVVSLEPGCVRLTGRIATFADGTKACVRYGIDANQVRGKTLSYYLVTLLGISNLPHLFLSKLSLLSHRWEAVRVSIETLQWSPNAIVSLTQCHRDLGIFNSPRHLVSNVTKWLMEHCFLVLMQRVFLQFAASYRRVNRV
uniref:Uncharacterized protein n=1 Tax=Electrophorus electricus TaxID=8005 RepID=A0AAY5EVA9_ELEEL